MRRKARSVSSAWIHNSYLGMAKMMEKQAVIIIASDTATDGAKVLASQIEQLAARLGRALKERKQ
jgi:hypothetical protein